MSRSCLLLVDVLSDFLHDDGERLLASFDERYPALCALVGGARRSQVPIVYANDNDGVWDGDASHLVRKALAGPGGDRIEHIAPRRQDRFVVKPRYSAFDHTPLELVLRSLDVGRIVLAGTATEMCVAHTALSAEQLGFDVAVVPEACACIDPQSEAIALAYLGRVHEIELIEVDEAAQSFSGQVSREPWNENRRKELTWQRQSTTS